MPGVGIGIGLSLGGGGGGGVSPAAATVPSATGVLYTISRMLGSASVLALLSGSNANLGLNASTGEISASAAIAAGASQKAIVRESLGDLAREFPLTLTGASDGTTPSLSATPTSRSVVANAPAGTLLFTISNVPANVTPTVSPNDGRFVVAGDATSGWKIVVGMSALSASAQPVNVSANAAGANGVTVPVTITAVAGTAATTAAAMGAIPTVQYHVPTSTLTMAPNGSFQGYMVAGSDKLTVTSLDTTACPCLRDGVAVSATGLPNGTTVKKTWSYNGGTPGNGSTGDYKLTAAATANIGSSGSPATFTLISNKITVISDLKGNADLSASDNVSGPSVITDPDGMTGLLFTSDAGSRNYANWLRNLTITGIDPSNFSWFMVARILTPTRISPQVNQSEIFVAPGAKELGNYDANYSQIDGPLNGHCIRPDTYNGNANYKKMFLGTQKQLIGVSIVTDDGPGGTGSNTTTRKTLRFLNNVSIDQGADGTGAARKTFQGFTVNSAVNNLGGGAIMVVYEIVGFLRGEMGTRAQMPTRAAAVAQAMTANHGIPDIAKNLIVFGDSRLTYNLVGYSNYLTDGGGVNIGRLLTDPGAPLSLPKNVRVMNLSFPGLGIDMVNALMDSVGEGRQFNQASPTATQHMLGGGNDYFLSLMGSNDTGQWPDNTWGGVAASGTAALGDDIYGGSYTATLNITNAANSNTYTVNSITGVIGIGSVISGSGYVSGIGGLTISPALKSTNRTSFTAMNFQPTALTSDVTATMKGYKLIAQALINRGFKGLWFGETYSGTNLAAPAAALAGHILNDMPNDTQTATGQANAGKLIVSDASLIQVGGQRVFGPNWQGANGDYYRDLIHYSTIGQRALFTGGDTPQYGVGYLAQQLIAR